MDGCLPVDILICVFMFVGPRQLYNSDLACVCKQWLAAVKALWPTLRRERWHAYSLSVGAILPRQVRTVENDLRIDLDVNGNVMCLSARSLSQVHGGWRCTLPLSKVCSHSMICETFSVIGPRLYFRSCNSLYVFKNGWLESLLDLQNITAIRTYNNHAWVLCQTGIYKIFSTTAIRVVEMSSEEPFWCDFVVIDDIIYIATMVDVIMIKDGERSVLPGLYGCSLHEHDGVLYVYNNDDMTVYIGAVDGSVSTRVVDKAILSIAGLGNCIFVAVKDAIEVWPAKGEPIHISSPDVQRLVATTNKVYALSTTGIISIYSQ